MLSDCRCVVCSSPGPTVVASCRNDLGLSGRNYSLGAQRTSPIREMVPIRQPPDTLLLLSSVKAVTDCRRLSHTRPPLIFDERYCSLNRCRRGEEHTTQTRKNRPKAVSCLLQGKASKS